MSPKPKGCLILEIATPACALVLAIAFAVVIYKDRRKPEDRTDDYDMGGDDVHARRKHGTGVELQESGSVLGDMPKWENLNWAGMLLFPVYFLLSLLLIPCTFLFLVIMFVFNGMVPIFLSLFLFCTPSMLVLLRGIWRDMTELAFYICFPLWLHVHQPTSPVITWSVTANQVSRLTIIFPSSFFWGFRASGFTTRTSTSSTPFHCWASGRGIRMAFSPPPSP